ncbi:MAG: OmpH family outer membrane protein [Alphaproteobacteria bacterium]|nr:MAG: OmpH family outer membrane protein [Alphaproteobacteria bacterium]
MKRTFGITCALVALLGASNANAFTMATVDMQRIMAEASAAKSAKLQLDSKLKEFQAQVKKTETELQKSDQELVKQRSLLSADVFKEKVQAFREKAANAQKDVGTKRMKLRQAFEASIGTIQARVITIITKMSQERNYDIVAPSAQLLYTKPSLDITNDVLQQLNKELPSMNVNVGG